MAVLDTRDNVYPGTVCPRMIAWRSGADSGASFEDIETKNSSLKYQLLAYLSNLTSMSLSLVTIRTQ